MDVINLYINNNFLNFHAIWWWSSSPSNAFSFYKGNLKIYKGKYASGAFWLSFLIYWSNQSDFFDQVAIFLLTLLKELMSVICHHWHLTLLLYVYCCWPTLGVLRKLSSGIEPMPKKWLAFDRVHLDQLLCLFSFSGSI